MYRVVRTLPDSCLIFAVIVGAVIFASSPSFAASPSKDESNSATNTAALLKKVAALEAVVADFEERRKIQNVYVFYGRGIDRLDEEAYRKSFWPDAQINYGTKESITPDQHWNDHMIKGFKSRGQAWGHLFTNQVIDIDGDVAHVETYLTILYVRKEPKDSSINAGRYIDKLERRGGEWRIAVREYMPHFAAEIDATMFDGPHWGTYFNGASSAACIEHASGKRDPAYARPLQRRETASGPLCAK